MTIILLRQAEGDMGAAAEAEVTWPQPTGHRTIQNRKRQGRSLPLNLPGNHGPVAFFELGLLTSRTRIHFHCFQPPNWRPCVMEARGNESTWLGRKGLGIWSSTARSLKLFECYFLSELQTLSHKSPHLGWITYCFICFYEHRGLVLWVTWFSRSSPSLPS